MLGKLMIGSSLFAGVVLLLVVTLAVFGPERYDRFMNQLGPDANAPRPTAADRDFHRSLFIADLHADTLKWDRDLLQRSAWGHVDLPRLVEGNVALQVFTIVTKSPLPGGSARYEKDGRCVSGERLDMAALLAALQGRSAFSARQRALVQVERLKEAVTRSRSQGGAELRLILDVDDLRQLMMDRRAGRAVVGAILGIEGGHWVGSGGLEAVDEDMTQLFELGARQFAPNHRFDNALTGSNEGCERYGLTPRGERALQVAEQLGMVVDLAHISPQGLTDAVGLLAKPFVISHTGVQHNCESPCNPARNLSDADIVQVLRHEGLIGIGFWPAAVGGDVGAIVDAMAHVMAIARSMGLEPGRQIAFGSDYDGSVTPFFDVSELDVLTAMMRQREGPLATDTIRDIAGLNVCRLFARTLPGGSKQAAREICALASAPAP